MFLLSIFVKCKFRFCHAINLSTVGWNSIAVLLLASSWFNWLISLRVVQIFSSLNYNLWRLRIYFYHRVDEKRKFWQHSVDKYERKLVSLINFTSTDFRIALLTWKIFKFSHFVNDVDIFILNLDQKRVNSQNEILKSCFLDALKIFRSYKCFETILEMFQAADRLEILKCRLEYYGKLYLHASHVRLCILDCIPSEGHKKSRSLRNWRFGEKTFHSWFFWISLESFIANILNSRCWF